MSAPSVTRTQRRAFAWTLVALCAALFAGPQTALAGTPVAPGAPTVALAARALIGPNPTITGGLTGAPTTTMTVLANSKVVWNGGVPAGDSYSIGPVSLPYGRVTLTVVAENEGGSASSAPVIVYNLGSTPPYARYLLVDKSDMQLYLISAGVVQNVYPIAIGMPGAPTHTGTFKLGRRQWMSRGSGYGVLRMPLLKRVKSHWRPSSYYIHGTYDTWSIGMMASHGCVRMYNWNVKSLARVAQGMIVVIRK
jgi:hypothetical protein